MIQVYCYDEQGNFTISKFVEKLEENMTTETWQGLYHQKWTGTEWVEGLTQEEIDAKNNNPKEPNEFDYLVDLDFRLSKIELGI